LLVRASSRNADESRKGQNRKAELKEATMKAKTKQVQQQRSSVGRPENLTAEVTMKRKTATKPKGSKRELHIPKALHAELSAGVTGKTGVSFFWVTKDGELIWLDDEVPEGEECLQILQLRKHMLPTEIILSQSEIAELREALGNP
jgi:hypothetical protein